MGVHGFAATQPFRLLSHRADSALLLLQDVLAIESILGARLLARRCALRRRFAATERSYLLFVAKLVR